MTPEQVRAIADAMPFAREVGLQIDSLARDEVVAHVIVEPSNCTVGHIAHGGFLMTIADCVGAIGSFLNLPEGAKGTTTTESKTNLVSAAPEGEKLMIKSTPVNVGRRLQVWQTRVERSDGKLVSLTTQSQLNL